MQFESFAEFIAMGGHGLFVWSAYGLTLAVLVINLVHPIVGQRRFLRAQKQALRREEAREGQ